MARLPPSSQTIPWRRVAFWSLLLGGTAALFGLAGGVLAPFLIGLVLAWMLNPLCTRLERRLKSRTQATILVTLLILAIIAVLLLATLPILFEETLAFVDSLPELIKRLDTAAEQLRARWYHKAPLLWENVFEKVFKDFDFTQSSAVIEKLLRWIAAGVLALSQQIFSAFTFFSLLLITPVITFYALKDWNSMIDSCVSRIPKGEEHLIALVQRIEAALSALIRGQIFVLVIMAVFYALSLSLIGLPFGFAIGVFAGCAMLVPYLGAALGMLVALTTAFLYFGASPPLLFTAVVFLVGQLLESYFLTPKLVGGKIGLHPIWIIFLVLAGGEIAGISGILLALPLGAAARAVIDHIDDINSSQ